ncbi:AAA family ATPase [Mycolicibacterium llatzerense]|uniref:AAA family ATPase n=1 Tax=Mycolicibacterium llatzerense TaxID=280871 RepID=UPI0008DCCEF8|nr:AAA family ATPase [Mycolicibacterium llatzerense]
MTSPTEQRRAFDAAIARVQGGDLAGARETFTRITEAAPAMSDAWIGRLASGDHSVAALAGAHANSRALYKETRRLGLQDGSLQAHVPAPLYLPIQVWSRGTIAVAYASGLIRDRQYDRALAVLDDPELTGDAQTALWRQFVVAALYHATSRWPDVCASTDVCPPRHATYVPAELLAGTQALRAMALSVIGQFESALDLIAVITTNNPVVAADLALTKGWCLREQGAADAAQDAFRSAVLDGQLIGPARQALDNPSYRIVTTDAETIATRTDKWDADTETSRAERDAAELADERRDVLATAQARIDELVGLEEAKEQIAVWRTEIQIEQLLASQGEGGGASNENHMVFMGPPGTAKTTFARVVGEVLFGLGKIARPDVKEVTEEDIVVGYVSQTAARMKEVCEEARGGVLFIDEAYRLVPTTEGHSFGKDAINTLLKYMEDFREDLVVIVAGYPREMQEFLRANAGLASRFHFTLTFASYTPDEVVAIGRHLAEQERLVVDDAAWGVLRTEAAQLRSLPYESGTMLDVAGNGRYARKVMVACKSERARRLYRAAPLPQDLEVLVRSDPSALKVNVDDMHRALAQARPATGP